MERKQKILIVDDKKENLIALKQILGELSAEIIEAASGNQALAATLDHQFAVAILDVQMPDMNGYELAEYLRGDQHSAGIPIIFITASYADEQHMFKGYEAGAVDYIMKPFSAEILRGKLKVFLAIDRDREELKMHREQLESLVADRTMQLNERLQELNEQYLTLTSIIDSANADIFSLDTHYCYTSFNQKHAEVMKKIYGTRIERGGNMLEYMTVPEDREIARRNLDLALAGENLIEEAYSGEELRSRRFFQISHSPIKTENGKIIGVAVLAQDISERKQAEEKLLSLNNELESKVKERTRDLELANAELESFSYSVSHDLRAPLRVIDGFSRILEEDCASALSESGLRIISKIRNGTGKMATLIDDLLKLAKISRTELQLERFNISQLVSDIFYTAAQAEPERTVSLKLEPDIYVNADKGLVKIAMENIIANAWKFTGKTQEPCIEFGTQKKNGDRICFLQDNGIGFDMAYVNKVFKPFQRLHNISDYEGTGVGLAIVERIFMRLGSRVWAESKPMEGTRISFVM